MALIPEIELKSPAEIKAFQEIKLKELLNYVHQYSPYYKKLFEENNIQIEKIHTIEDFKKLPVTTKNDLSSHNAKFICVSKEKIIDYVTTSGTIGDPVLLALTDKDLNRLAYNEQISLQCTGATPTDIFQIVTTLDRRR